MGYTEEFELDEISKGKIIRRFPNHTDEYFEIGDFYTEIGGWELRPNGRNTYNWDGILLYVKPESIKGRFELFVENV